MCISLCASVVHNTAHNSSDNFPSYHSDNHHSSDEVYWRGGRLLPLISLSVIVLLPSADSGVVRIRLFLSSPAVVEGDQTWV